MKSDDAIDVLAERFGILPSFRDLSGKDISTSRDTNIALLRANGLQLDNDAMALEELTDLKAAEKRRPLPREMVLSRDKAISIDIAAGLEWTLCLEGQENAIAEGRSAGSVKLPAMPSGIHTLSVGQGSVVENVLDNCGAKGCTITFGRHQPSKIMGRHRCALRIAFKANDGPWRF